MGLRLSLLVCKWPLQPSKNAMIMGTIVAEEIDQN